VVGQGSNALPDPEMTLKITGRSRVHCAYVHGYYDNDSRKQLSVSSIGVYRRIPIYCRDAMPKVLMTRTDNAEYFEAIHEY
jgi:hypothetical protein